MSRYQRERRSKYDLAMQEVELGGGGGGGGGGRRTNEEEEEEEDGEGLGVGQKTLEDRKEEEDNRVMPYDEMRRRIREDESRRAANKMKYNIEIQKAKDEKEKSRLQNNAMYRFKEEEKTREREREREKDARNHWASSDPHTALYSLNSHTGGREHFLTFYLDIPWHIHSTRFLFEVSTHVKCTCKRYFDLKVLTLLPLQRYYV